MGQAFKRQIRLAEIMLAQMQAALAEAKALLQALLEAAAEGG